MKKCMNHSHHFGDNSLDGIYKAYPGFYEKENRNTRSADSQKRDSRKGRYYSMNRGSCFFLETILGTI
ncbi:MAG: hypothetical protein HFG65_12350 [Hungatella sp.]|nr:hypothetical protein [Hungatella sp.]